ncbi:MAG: DUF2262 domain-containing protein [Oscillospiraceae bacterium]|nr:DUF2262 domain-containing protein [Oscillospiraceae bacterium]
MSNIISGKEVDKFERRFGTDEIELLFLTVQSVGGAIILGDGILNPSIEFVASVNLTTGAFSKEKGRLEWLIADSKDHQSWGYDFKKFNIYHIRCRKNIPVKLDQYMKKTMNNCYMVTEVIDDGLSSPKLEKLKEKYLEPVYIEDHKIGKFTLNRELSLFKGNIDWLGHDCSVHLETDRDGGKSANKAFTHLKSLYADIFAWDEKFRRFAAVEMIETANEWSTDDEVITEEQFADMIYISELAIDPRGEITAYYSEDKDIFGGHAIAISAAINGNLKYANLVG